MYVTILKISYQCRTLDCYAGGVSLMKFTEATYTIVKLSYS